MPTCATKDDMKRRWLAVMRVTQRTYSPNDRAPYDSLPTLGQFGITYNILSDMFSNFKRRGKSRSHDEAEEEYINEKTSIFLSGTDGITRTSNRLHSHNQRMFTCATKDDMKRRWLAVMRVTQRTYSPNDRAPYDSLPTLGQFGITRNILSNMFSSFKKRGKSRSHDEAEGEYINEKTSIFLSVTDVIPRTSNRETIEICGETDEGVSSNCKSCEKSSSSGDLTFFVMKHIQLGMLVKMKRFDGRVHDAFVYKKHNCGVIVRWFESEAGACVAKMKNICVEELLLLNPELAEKGCWEQQC